MTYGFCLKSSRSVQESWTRCCFGERMDGCQVFGPLQEKEQEKGCLEHVPRPHEKNNWGKKKGNVKSNLCGFQTPVSSAESPSWTTISSLLCWGVQDVQRILKGNSAISGCYALCVSTQCEHCSYCQAFKLPSGTLLKIRFLVCFWGFCSFVCFFLLFLSACCWIGNTHFVY